MTNEELKAAIKAKGYTLKAFAEVLGVAYATLRLALSGKQPLTEQLRRHIMLALQASPQQDGQRAPLPLTLSLPVEIWQGIDTAAEKAGMTPERYTQHLCQRIARDIATGLIISRPDDQG